MAIQIQLQSTNYNGQLADITFYPCSGGTISLGYQTIPYTYTNDNYEGTYDLFFSGFNQTCQLVITCPTPTPTVTPTNTATPTPTLTTTPTNTPTLTPTPTASAGPAFDVDAAAYLSAVVSAGGAVTSPMSAATNNMFLALKSNNLYNKLEIFYPMIGGISNSIRIEAKGRTAFNINFTGALTFNYSGVTMPFNNGVFGETNFVPSVDATGMTSNSVHIAMYNGITGDGNGYVGTINNFSSNKLYLLLNYSSSPSYVWPAANDDGAYYILTGSPINTTGMWISTRENPSTVNLYGNGSLVLSGGATASVGLPPSSIHIPGVSQTGNSNWGTSSGRLQFASVGQGLSAGESATLSSIINAFQTALGRNTY